MRRALATVLALLAIALPAPVLAQSPGASGPPSYPMAPGVTFEPVAFLPGTYQPIVFRIRFQPGSSVDLDGTPNASLVSIERGSLVGNVGADLVLYSGSGTTGRTAQQGTDTTMQEGDFFVVPAGVPGHVRNDTGAEASMLVASLPITGLTPAGSPSASEVPPG